MDQERQRNPGRGFKTANPDAPQILISVRKRATRRFGIGLRRTSKGTNLQFPSCVLCGRPGDMHLCQGQVPNPEEAACVDGATLIHVISTHMRQARCREIDSRAGHHPVLYRNVFEMLILNVGCGFNFDQSPALVFATIEHIDAHENAIVLKRAFKDCRDVSVSISSRVARIA